MTQSHGSYIMDIFPYLSKCSLLSNGDDENCKVFDYELKNNCIREFPIFPPHFTYFAISGGKYLFCDETNAVHC